MVRQDHAATGIEYLTLRQRLEQNESTAFVVLTRDGRIRSLSVEAQRILEAIPEKPTLPCPDLQKMLTYLALRQSGLCRQHPPGGPAALIGIGDAHSLPCASAVARLADRLAVAPDEQRRELAVTIKRLNPPVGRPRRGVWAEPDAAAETRRDSAAQALRTASDRRHSRALTAHGA